MEPHRKYFGGWVTNPGKLVEISRLKWGFQRDHPTKLGTYGSLKFEPTSGDRISSISRILVWFGFAKKSACCSYSRTNNVMLSIPTALGWRLKHAKIREIMRYCWWKKSCTSWCSRYPSNHNALYIPGGAGFLPTTVSWDMIFTISTDAL